MFTIINNTSETIGPYNGITISAKGSLAVSGPASPYLANGNLLADAIISVVSIAFADNTVSGLHAASLLLQLGQITDADVDGAGYARIKIVPTGMTFNMRCFEFTTSAANSLVNNDVHNNPMSDVTIKFYDASNTQLTNDLSTCVKTIVDFEPIYDYYIIGGQLRLGSAPLQDIRAHVIALPDVPSNMGGSKVMIQNVNLKYISIQDKIEANGRAAKPLQYNATYHTNKISFIFYHPAGYQQMAMASLEIFI